MTMKKLLLAGGAAAMLTATSAYASILDRPFFKVLGVVVVWGSDGVNGTDDAPVVNDFVLLTPANSGAAGDDLIGGAGVNDGATVVTGTLEAIVDTDPNVETGGTAVDPVTGTGAGTYGDDDADGVLSAGDSLSVFGLDATTDVGAGMVNEHNSSFYVASNAAFDIYAESSAFTMTGDFDTDATLTMANITYEMAFGADEILGGMAIGTNANDAPGTVQTVADLSVMDGTPTMVYQGTSRTANARGNLASQSVRFDNTYTLDDGTGLGYDLSMGSGTVQADVTYTIYVP